VLQKGTQWIHVVVKAQPAERGDDVVARDDLGHHERETMRAFARLTHAALVDAAAICRFAGDEAEKLRDAFLDAILSPE
jgi:hypothetical protein